MVAQDEILGLVRDAATTGRVELTGHALDRMDLMGLTVDDVLTALRSATWVALAHEPNRFRICGGEDLDGDERTVVVELEWLSSDVVVVTVW